MNSEASTAPAWSDPLDNPALAPKGKDPALRATWLLERLEICRRLADRELGRRLARMTRVDGFKWAGFRGVGDYAEEVLDLNRRTAQELARVGGALEELPLLRNAYDAGAIGHSKLRLVLQVVTPETQALWVVRARRLTVRELKEAIREGGDTTIEEEEAREHVSFEAPSWFRARWDVAIEHARRVAGANIPEAEAAEMLVAEWMSEAPPEEDPPQSLLERYEPPPDDDCELDGEGLAKQVAKLVLPLWFGRYRGPIRDFWKFLDLDMRQLAWIRRRLEGALLRFLLELEQQDRLRGGLVRFARERLGMAAGSARQLAWLARHLKQAPAVKKAFLAGCVGLARVRVLLQLAEVRPLGRELAEAWLERADAVTVRRLGDEVRDVLLGERLEPGSGLEPPPPGAQLGRYTSAQSEILPERTCRARPVGPLTDRVAFSAEWSFVVVWREAVARCRRLAGPGLAEWEAADRFIDAFVATYPADERAGTLAQRVYRRDDWRCTVPSCGARSNLHAHHIELRSAGGEDVEHNLTTMCSFHHQHCLHHGLISVRGEAPDNLVWELGDVVIWPGERLMVREPAERYAA